MFYQHQQFFLGYRQCWTQEFFPTPDSVSSSDKFISPSISNIELNLNISPRTSVIENNNQNTNNWSVYSLFDPSTLNDICGMNTFNISPLQLDHSMNNKNSNNYIISPKGEHNNCANDNTLSLKKISCYLWGWRFW